MSYIVALEIVVSILSCVGMALIAIPRVSGLFVFAGNGVLWIIYFALTDQLFAMGSVMFILLFEIYAIYRWMKKGIGRNVESR